MESDASRDSAHSIKLAGGRVIVDARSLGQSIDQWLILSHARLPKPRGNRGFEEFPAPIGLYRTGFRHQTRPLAGHRYPRSIPGPIRPKSPWSCGLPRFKFRASLSATSIRVRPHLKGGACVRRIVLDPIAGSRQRQGPGAVAGGGVDLHSMIIRRLVRRGEFASFLPVTG